ncbi:MAG: efflux transporter periplasmic adaptor subunit [Desulfuromonadaceae bacterium GWB2_53_15]|nr:MAG: efflux transporter periplasmic adaptor subunit [Desulfuromonadaceae bacterium GWB2_53_15]
MRSSRFCMALGLMATLSVAGCSAKQHEAGKKPGTAATVVKGTTIETVKSAAIAETLEVVGTVQARTSAVVSTRIPGTVSVLRVREGDRVKKGQLLAQLDAQENQATAAVAFAGIDEARHGLDEALSRKKLADTTFERYHRLFNEQAVTRQEFDTRQSEKELAAQGVARAEARLKQAQEGSRAATTMSDYTRIVAPISGIITSKQVDLGATVFPAQPLMTIEDEGSYQLELAVPESQATRIKAGTAVLVTLDALDASFRANIAEIVPTADPASRTFLAKIKLTQKGLKSGMFGRGALNLGTTVNGITVPQKSVVERGALTSLWVLDKDSIARMRLVKTGKTVGERVEILSGLSDGEKVVVGGVEKVSEGAKVE